MLASLRQLDKDEYPAPLLEIPEPPEVLWMEGAWAPAGTKHLAVVGSRALSRYGREACEMLIAGLAGYPVSIVSGLALGADGCAHRAALKAGLHTVAVPGSGLGPEVMYPRSHTGLARDIVAAGGALLSEHAPDHKPYSFDFPSRNRIMVGLSDAVLVIEAGEKSGTLITARLASEYNRDLLCVPHRIGDPHGFAAHLFVRLGAALVTEPIHILEALGIPPRQGVDERLTASLQGAEKAVYEMLREPLPRDEAIRKSKTPAGETLTALVSLELKGLIREEFGAWRRL